MVAESFLVVTDCLAPVGLPRFSGHPRHGNVGTGGVQMAGTKPPYPPQFRIEAVRLVKDSERPISRIAAELGVSHETLRQ